MAHCKTVFHSRPDQPPNAHFAAIKPGQLDIQMVHDLSLCILLAEFMHVREFRKRPVKQSLSKSLRRVKNVMSEPENDRQDPEHRPLRPRLATNLDIRPMPQHANMLLFDMQQR